MISAAMLFAFGGVAAKVLRSADMDAFRLTQIRTTGAALILITFAVLKGKSQLYARKDELKDLIIFGTVGVAAVTSFYFFAIKYRLRILWAVFTFPNLDRNNPSSIRSCSCLC